MGDTGGDVFLGHPDAATKNGCHLWIIGWRSWISYSSVFFLPILGYGHPVGDSLTFLGF
jgi:hypothetical protein